MKPNKPNIQSLVIIFLLCAYFGVVWPSQGQDTFEVGIIQYKSREKVEASYGPLLDYLGKQLGKEVRITILPDEETGYTEEDLAFLLAHDEFHLGIFTVFPYLSAKNDFPQLSVFASHEVDGEEHFYGNILVRKGAGINNLKDLEGKDFLFVKRTSTSGFKYPNGILKEHSIDIEHGFFNYEFSGDHLVSIQRLFQGEVDGIAVDESRIAKAQGVNPEEFQVLERYEVPYHAYVFAPGMEEDERKVIKDVMFKAHLDPKARRAFKNPLGIEKWVRKSDDYYNIIRRYLRIVREKPYVEVSFNLSDAAKNLMAEHDLLNGVSNRLSRLLAQSKRFSVQPSNYHRLAPEVKLSLVKGQFHYQVILDGAYIGEGDVREEDMMSVLPETIARDLLVSQNLKSTLLNNGTDWFITYGSDDGINPEDYQFEVSSSNGVIVIEGNEVQMDGLNTFFQPNGDFAKNATVTIEYTATVETPEESGGLSSGSWNIFSPDFWKDAHFWDKLGLIAGIVMAIVSALLGRYLAQRKKRKFKNILYQTNELVKEYLEGHYRLENKLIEQKDFIGKCLEDGNINEQQFILLNQRIDDLHDIVERHQSSNVTLQPEQSEEIREIIKDGKITEREFAKIMSILRKGTSTSKPSAN